MNDSAIIELYFKRDERAISETDLKYGRYCYTIAFNILSDDGDSRETVNDTYLRTWNSIPPHKPNSFTAFLARITRNLSLDRLKIRSAAKRGGGQYEILLSELDECIQDKNDADSVIERDELIKRINSFLGTLNKTERDVFVCRYFLMQSIKDISQGSGLSCSKITSMLFRTRNKLKTQLVREGYIDE